MSSFIAITLKKKYLVIYIYIYMSGNLFTRTVYTVQYTF